MTCGEWKRLIDVATAILFVSGMINIVGVMKHADLDARCNSLISGDNRLTVSLEHKQSRSNLFHSVWNLSWS